MKLTALDLSLAHSGWAVYKDSTEHWGTLTTSELAEPYADLARLKRIVTELGEIARGSDLVIVEGFAFARPQYAHQLGALGYLMRMWLWGHDLPFVVVAPKSNKKWCAGNGNAKKDLMLREVTRRWNVVIDDDNAADAYALLKLGESLVGLQDFELTDFQREVVHTIEEKQKDRYEHLTLLARPTAV